MFARETEGEESELKTSTPVSVTVIIRDINDNPPVLATIEDVTITAGNKRRKIAKVKSCPIILVAEQLYIHVYTPVCSY